MQSLFKSILHILTFLILITALLLLSLFDNDKCGKKKKKSSEVKELSKSERQ